MTFGKTASSGLGGLLGFLYGGLGTAIGGIFLGYGLAALYEDIFAQPITNSESVHKTHETYPMYNV
ncbi:MAG: hypothetical protein ABIG84_04390 [archaeon]